MIHADSAGVNRVAKACCIEVGFNASTVVGLFRRVVVGMFDNGVVGVDFAVATSKDHLCPELVFPEGNARQWNVFPGGFS